MNGGNEAPRAPAIYKANARGSGYLVQLSGREPSCDQTALHICFREEEQERSHLRHTKMTSAYQVSGLTLRKFCSHVGIPRSVQRVGQERAGHELCPLQQLIRFQADQCCTTLLVQAQSYGCRVSCMHLDSESDAGRQLTTYPSSSPQFATQLGRAETANFKRVSCVPAVRSR